MGGNEGLFLLPLLILQKQAEVQTFVGKINDDLTISFSSTISFMAFSNCTMYIVHHCPYKKSWPNNSSIMQKV
jgi:hypothetical protein